MAGGGGGGWGGVKNGKELGCPKTKTEHGRLLIYV